MPAKALAGDAGGGVDDEAEGAGQGHGALVPEAQRSGSLALPYAGLVDALEERRADGTALAGMFDHKQAVVDLAGLADQLGQASSRAGTPMSAGLLITVSMRSALPSFRYCFTRLCLKEKSIFTSVPGENTLARMVLWCGEARGS